MQTGGPDVFYLGCSEIMNLKSLRKGRCSLVTVLSPLQSTFFHFHFHLHTQVLWALNDLPLPRGGAPGKWNMGFGAWYPMVEIYTLFLTS